jgi:hypothetical protein
VDNLQKSFAADQMTKQALLCRFLSLEISIFGGAKRNFWIDLFLDSEVLRRMKLFAWDLWKLYSSPFYANPQWRSIESRNRDGRWQN